MEGHRHGPVLPFRPSGRPCLANRVAVRPLDLMAILKLIRGEPRGPGPREVQRRAGTAFVGGFGGSQEGGWVA